MIARYDVEVRGLAVVGISEPYFLRRQLTFHGVFLEFQYWNDEEPAAVHPTCNASCCALPNGVLLEGFDMSAPSVTAVSWLCTYSVVSPKAPTQVQHPVLGSSEFRSLGILWF